MSNYSISDKDIAGFSIIEVTEGIFKGIKYVYGGVIVDIEEDQAKLKYDYRIIEGDKFLVDSNKEQFKKLTGDILTAILNEQLERNEVVYSGGVDEN